jgi:Acetyltransferase (GNAT) family
MLLGLFAYEGADLVGYSVSIFNPSHLHYRSLAVVVNDVLYVKPEHRHGRAGLGLIRETERIAKDLGAKLLMWHAKPDTALAAILPRLAYGVQDVLFSREL